MIVTSTGMNRTTNLKDDVCADAPASSVHTNCMALLAHWAVTYAEIVKIVITDV